ncbi:hypothetical protein OPQ81_001272 [Rhizoctonia solani]|nr:hypothetical protein OPQ81_001272 [Rhizoctonia solani]
MSVDLLLPFVVLDFLPYEHRIGVLGQNSGFVNISLRVIYIAIFGKGLPRDGNDNNHASSYPQVGQNQCACIPRCIHNHPIIKL